MMDDEVAVPRVSGTEAEPTGRIGDERRQQLARLGILEDLDLAGHLSAVDGRGTLRVDETDPSAPLA